MASNVGSYKLKCSIHGHSMDVRAVTPTVSPVGGILTGSRDKTTKIWLPDETSNGYKESASLSGPTNFVSSICCLPSDDNNPHGLIVVGSNDSNIYCYSPDSSKPLYKLEGHTGTVCSLAAGRFGTLLSGSWDQLAKVWLGKKNMMTLSGHEASVWAVQILPELGIILTGSADRTVKMWKAGKCEHTFLGHTDCVRGLATIHLEEFLSCANDATIRRWSINSLQCLQVYYGHTNFIYSVNVIPNTGGLQFVTSSEDRSVRIWNVAGTSGDENIQTIRLPAQSIWSTACLENGDIIVGSSDGVARVFTTIAELQASPEEQKQLEEEVSKTSLNAEEIGDLKVSDLPSKEALFEPGKQDGHTKMIRDGSVVTAYQWNAAETRWIKIGDVVGANESSKSSSGKTVFEGQEYDYVFTVDIEEGKPPLSLPYNIKEDPWFAAQKFIMKNNLSQVFLEQVANFIIENAKGVTLAQGSSSAVSDPFTGGNRYVPNTGNSVNNSVTSDPFTGAGRYIPTYNDQQRVSSSGSDPFTGDSRYTSKPRTKDNKYFPQKSYVKFEAANITGIINKLKEFNAAVESAVQLSDSQIVQLQETINFQKELSDNDIFILESILKWHDEIVFPALDILRLVFRNESNIRKICDKNKGDSIVQLLMSYICQPTISVNHMLSLRTLCNFFCADISEDLLNASRNVILTQVVQSCSRNSLNKQLQIALTTLLLNYSILFNRKGNIESKSQLMSVLVTIIDYITEAEAMFRFLVCIGTLMYNDLDAVDTAKSFDLLIPVKKLREIIDPTKVSECAGFLEEILS